MDVKRRDQVISKTFRDGEEIFAENDLGRDFFIIQEGAVGIWRETAEGQELKINRLGRGDFFGEMGLMESLPRSATVRAEGDTTLLILGPGGFLLKLRRDPTFAFEIIQQLCSRVRFLTDSLIEQVNLSDCSLEDASQKLSTLSVRAESWRRDQIDGGDHDHQHL